MFVRHKSASAINKFIASHAEGLVCTQQISSDAEKFPLTAINGRMLSAIEIN